jgi:hypothetical protein
MNYTEALILKNIQTLDDYVDRLDHQVLIPYKDQIMQLSKDDQKKEWQKYHLINNCLKQSIDTVTLLYNDRSQMYSKQDMDYQKRVIAALRKYIYVLGGNPSIINFTTNSDLL